MRDQLFCIGLTVTLFSGCGSTDSAEPAPAAGAAAVVTGGTAAAPTGGVGNAAMGGVATGGAGAGGTPTGGGAAVTGGTGSGGEVTAAAATGGEATGGAAAGGAATGGSGDTGGAGGTQGGSGGSSGAVTGGSGGDLAGGSGGDTAGGSGGDLAGGSGGDTTGGTGGTTDSIDCTRAGLANAVDVYLAAIEAHDPSLMPGYDTARYTENASDVNLGESLWATAGEVAYLHSIFDTTNCNSFSFVVSSWLETGEADREPIVMGVRLKVGSNEITEVEAIITRDGDWLFDAEGFQTLASADGEWSILDASIQQTRAEIQYPADCYFDAWVELIDDADVPLAPGCLRLEGSMNGGCDMLGTADDDDVGFGDRHYVIDVEKGAVALIGLFGGDFGGALDVHLFRVVEGLIERIHTATVYHDPDFVSATGWDPY